MAPFSFPPAFEERMKHGLQDHWPPFLQSHLQPSPVSIRINQKKSAQYEGVPVPWTASGFYLPERPVFTLDPRFHAGAYYVQEASSMLLEQAFKQWVPAGSLNVLDLCAAPGGKSTHILSLLEEESLLVANEVIRSRTSILSENLQKWGHFNTVITQNDPQDFKSLPGFFDVIVVDAPCSGEGLFRKDPEATKEWSPENAARCASRQKRILADIFPSLKEGGILIYSTCTYNPDENEYTLEWLQQHHAIKFLSLQTDPSWSIEKITRNGITGYQAYPHRVQGEGFFLSVIQKCEPANSPEFKKNKKSNRSDLLKKIPEQVTNWVLSPEQKVFQLHNDHIYFFPSQKEKEVELITDHLRIVKAGTTAATVKRDKLIPEHSLALSLDLDRSNFPIISLEKEDALEYLRKATPTWAATSKGFSLVTFENLALGWVNVLDNRINNMYPMEWRIRQF